MERIFNVGDRVRVVRSLINPGLDGTETVITDVGDARDPRDESLAPAYEVDLPNGHYDEAKRFPLAWFAPWQLEPIYDGNELVAWSDCVWKPNQVSV